MSIHVCKCIRNGREEYHLRYPGMPQEAAQELADKINAGALQDLTAQLTAAESKLAECQRDAERLEWLDRNFNTFGEDGLPYGMTIRQAIDAAMSAKGGAE